MTASQSSKQGSFCPSRRMQKPMSQGRMTPLPREQCRSVKEHLASLMRSKAERQGLREWKQHAPDHSPQQNDEGERGTSKKERTIWQFRLKRVKQTKVPHLQFRSFAQEPTPVQY